MNKIELRKFKRHIENMTTEQLMALWKWIYLFTGNKLLVECIGYEYLNDTNLKEKVQNNEL